jgi:hypothetical protein
MQLLHAVEECPQQDLVWINQACEDADRNGSWRVQESVEHDQDRPTATFSGNWFPSPKVERNATRGNQTGCISSGHASARRRT